MFLIIMKGVDKLNMKDIQFIWYQAGLSRISSKSTCQKSIIQTPGKYFIFNYSNNVKSRFSVVSLVEMINRIDKI